MTMTSQKLAIISANGLDILKVENKACESYITDNTSIYEGFFDYNGTYFCYCSSNGCFLLNMESGSKTTLTNSARCRKICFSPKSTYICVFMLNNGNTNEDNVCIYQTRDGTLYHSYKYGNNGSWAPQWSADELLSIKLLKSEVLLYKESSFDRFTGKISFKGLEKASMQMCPTQNAYNIATYIKGTSGMPHMIKIYRSNNLAEPINNRSVFKATDVYMKWNPSGKWLLFLVHVENTKTNYYGENSLFFMSAEIGGETAIVSMPKDDNSFVHSVDWQPSSTTATTGVDRFVVTYGNPVNVAVFNTKCQLMYHIDAPNRNVLQFSNCGRLLGLVGVGNMRCSLQVWNFHTTKMVGEIDVADVNRVCWSGDDRYFCSATVSPSLRVNNGVIVWDVDGEVVADKATIGKLINNPSEIYHVLWQPSPVAKDDHGVCEKRSGSFYFNAQCQRFKEKQNVKPQKAYVPPHLRNKAGGGGGGVQVANSGAGPNIKFTPDRNAPQSATKSKKKNRNKAAASVNNNTATAS